MKHITTWHPDTCACVIQYEWDDTEPEATRVHTAVGSTTCNVHKQHRNRHDKAMAAVYSENSRKNMTLHKILETFPHVRENAEKDPTKAPAYIFKQGHEPQWSFNADRKLVIEAPTLTEEHKTTLKGLVNTDEVTIV